MSRRAARVVLIDGRSGSGKTSFAERLARELDAGLLHLDDLYPGWDGLAVGSRAVAAALRDRGYRRYDWETAAFAEWVDIDRSRSLIIEGCGALTAENLVAAREFAASGTAWAIWMECAAEVRKARALGRDGEMFASHWDAWAAQEAEQIAAHQPVALANEIVHTS